MDDATTEREVVFEIDVLAAGSETQPFHPNGPGRVVIDAVGAWGLTFDRRAGLNDIPLTWEISSGRQIDGSWLRLIDDGQRGLRLTEDGTIAVAPMGTGQPAVVLEGLRWPAKPPLPTADGRFAISALGQDSTTGIRPAPFTDVWELERGRRVGRLEGAFLVGALLPGARFVSMDPDNTLTIWDLPSATRGTVVAGTKGVPAGLRVTTDGRRAVTIGAKGAVTVWDLDNEAVVAVHDALGKLRGGPPPLLRLLADGRRLVAEGHFLDVLDLETGELDRSWVARDPNRDTILEVAALAGGALTSLAGDAGSFVAILMSRGLFDPNTLEVWDVDRRLCVGSTVVPDATLLAVAPSGHALLAGDDGVVSVRIQRRGISVAPPSLTYEPKQTKPKKAAPKKAAPKKKTGKRSTRAKK